LGKDKPQSWTRACAYSALANRKAVDTRSKRRKEGQITEGLQKVVGCRYEGGTQWGTNRGGDEQQYIRGGKGRRGERAEVSLESCRGGKESTYDHNKEILELGKPMREKETGSLSLEVSV